jgi:hypothetical protein
MPLAMPDYERDYACERLLRPQRNITALSGHSPSIEAAERWCSRVFRTEVCDDGVANERDV